MLLSAGVILLLLRVGVSTDLVVSEALEILSEPEAHSVHLTPIFWISRLDDLGLTHADVSFDQSTPYLSVIAANLWRNLFHLSLRIVLVVRPGTARWSNIPVEPRR